MFTCFAVSYDLRTKNAPDYAGVFTELKKCPAWWHHLESTWLVLTMESADELSRRLLPHIHKNDNILVIEVRNHSAGWLAKAAWEWIRSQVPAPAAV